MELLITMLGLFVSCFVWYHIGKDDGKIEGKNEAIDKAINDDIKRMKSRRSVKDHCLFNEEDSLPQSEFECPLHHKQMVRVRGMGMRCIEKDCTYTTWDDDEMNAGGNQAGGFI